MEDIEYLVVGAGVTGLSFANFVDTAPDNWLIIERENEPGGYCRTVLQDGFVWDYSGHFFHFRHPEIEQFLKDRMPGQRVETIQKSAGILYNGHRIDFPFQKNIHQLPKQDFLECLHDLYFRNSDRTIESFLDMVHARFGRAISEKFLVPYNEKLYACDLDRLDADAMGRFFPHADIGDIIRNFTQADNSSYNATFTYPAGGAIQYVNALLHDLPDDRICYGESLQHIDIDARIATTNRRRIRYGHLVSSIPYVHLMDAAGRPWDKTQFTWNKVLVFNLGFDSKGQTVDHWQYIPDRDICFYRVGFYDNIFDTERMSLYIEIGLSSDENVGDTNQWLKQVLSDLKTLGIVNQQQLISWHSVLLDPAYVHIASTARTRVDTTRAELQPHGIHSLGRYGGWTYCAIEDNIVEARDLAHTLGLKKPTR
ncbi:MAG: NAD(P)-binding protein [Myxococcota bacterium]|nr:NAD(P)-binding protein [Myxococcota bacterium]